MYVVQIDFLFWKRATVGVATLLFWFPYLRPLFVSSSYSVFGSFLYSLLFIFLFLDLPLFVSFALSFYIFVSLLCAFFSPSLDPPFSLLRSFHY